jgi:hypothetical protein
MTRIIACAILLGAALLPFRATAQSRGHFQAGVHGGFDFTEGEIDGERIGLQGSIPVHRLVTIDPVFSYLYNYPDDPTGFFEGSAWQGYLTVRVHPFGAASFLGLGYGLTLAHASLRTSDGTFSDSDSDATDVGVIGLTLPAGRFRPFAEVYLVDLLERQSAVGGNLLFGVNLRIP